MSSGRKKRRMNLNADRLSNLPDDILHKILSCVGTKAVVRTSSLSSRWRFLWTSMPYLFFTSRAFPSMRKFYQSVINVLSNRNNEIQVFSLSLCVYGSPSDAFFDLVLDYAFSHNVQELTIKCKKKFHFFDFSSESLKVLTLDGIEFDCDDICTSNWELPALTTLHLIGVTLLDDQDFDIGECNDVNECWDEFFSKCPNLKTLTFDCSNGGGEFHICHPTLSNLELANVYGDYTTFSVDTPQLKYLSIINCVFVHLLSTPELTSLIYKHPNTFEFDADCLSSLEKVDFCICNPDEDNIFMKGVVDVLQKFQSVKFLTINVEFLELLYWESDSNEPSPLANLKSLKIYPAIIDEVEEYDEIEEYDFQKYDEDDEYDFEYELKYEDDHEEEEEDENKEEYEGVEEDADKEEDGDEEDEDEDEDEEEDEEEDDAVNIGAEVKNFFLNSSPSATVTNVTCQEIKAVTTPELVINLMKELQVLLKEEKAKIFMARKKQGKTPMQSHVTELHQQGKTEVMKKMQLLAEERVLSTESRWKDPTVQYYLENGKIGHMVSKLQAIEGILATFPNSKRGQMKACFRRLLAEANLVMKKLDDATSRNIGEGRVEEQLPQNQKECDTTPGRWGNWYKRRSKQQGPGRLGNWYKRRSKQQGPGRWGNWYERRSKQQGPGRWGNWYRRRSKQQGSGRWGKWYKRHPNNKDHSALAHKG